MFFMSSLLAEFLSEVSVSSTVTSTYWVLTTSLNKGAHVPLFSRLLGITYLMILGLGQT